MQTDLDSHAPCVSLSIYVDVWQCVSMCFDMCGCVWMCVDKKAWLRLM